MRCYRSVSRTRLRRNMWVCVGSHGAAWKSCCGCTHLIPAQRSSEDNRQADTEMQCTFFQTNETNSLCFNFKSNQAAWRGSFWLNASCFSPPILSCPSPLPLLCFLFFILPLFLPQWLNDKCIGVVSRTGRKSQCHCPGCFPHTGWSNCAYEQIPPWRFGVYSCPNMTTWLPDGRDLPPGQLQQT